MRRFRALLLGLLALCGALQAQDISVIGPTTPIQRDTWEIIQITGLSESDLPSVAIEISPSEGVMAIPTTIWGSNHALWFRASKPGKYSLTVSMNRWRRNLESALIEAKKSKIPADEITEIERLVDRFSQKYPLKVGLASLEVAGQLPPPPPVDPVDPTPPPSTGKRLVVIIQETQDTTWEQAATWTAIRDGQHGQYIKSKGHRLYILDKDSKDENGQPSQFLKPYLDLISKDSLPLPAMFIADLDKGHSAVFFKGKAPETADRIIEEIKKTGG